jgi:hypothetical protein
VGFGLGGQKIDMKRLLGDEIDQPEFSGDREGAALPKPTVIASICP